MYPNEQRLNRLLWYDLNPESIMKAAALYFLAGWSIAPIIQFINKYVFDDWEFVKFLVVLCMVDTAMGFVKAIKTKKVSSRGFSMVFYKIIVYASALVSTHVLVHFSIEHKVNAVFGWFDSVVFSAIVVREAISIFENISIILPGAFPTTILKYLSQFDSITGRAKEENKL